MPVPGDDPTPKYRPGNPFAKAGGSPTPTKHRATNPFAKQGAKKAASPPPEEEQPGFIESAISGVARGITSDFNDEAYGKFESATGGDYRKSRDAMRAHDSAAENAHPTTVHIGQIVGGLGPAVVGGAFTKGAGLLHSVLTGAGFGALEGAGAAKEKEDIPTESLIGAGAGGAFGGALHMGGSVLSKMMRPVTDAVSNVASSTANKLGEGRVADALRTVSQSIGTKGKANARINQAFSAEGKTPESVRADLDRNVATSGDKPEMPADYSTEVKKLTAGVSKRPGPGRAKINQAIQDRAEQTRGRVLQDFTQGGKAVAADPEAAASPALPSNVPPEPTRPNAPVDPRPGGKQRIVDAFQNITGAGATDVRGAAEQEVRDRAASGAELFGTAHASEATLDTPEAHELFQRPVMRTLWERAQRMAANRGETLPTRPGSTLKPETEAYLKTIPQDQADLLRETFMKDPRSVEQVPIPNVRALHYMDIALRDSQKGFEGSSGIGKSDASDARSILDQFRPMISEAEPALPAAQADYAGRSRSVDAYDEGFKFLKTLGGSRTPKGARGAGDPVALKNFRTGISGLESMTRNMAPEDLQRFRRGAQQAVLETLQGATEGEGGSASPMLKGILKDSPIGRRWQQLLFESPEDFQQFQRTVNGERQAGAGLRTAKQAFTGEKQAYRDAVTARTARQKLVTSAGKGQPEARATLARELPGGGASTLRRLGQEDVVKEINSIPALEDKSTTSVLSRTGPFPDSPEGANSLRDLFPDEGSANRMRSALDRERTMKATNKIAGGSPTTELKNETTDPANAVAVHSIPGFLRSLFAHGDEVANKRVSGELGSKLSGTGSDAIQSLLADLMRARVGQNTMSRSGSVLRNAVIPSLPLVGQEQ